MDTATKLEDIIDSYTKDLQAVSAFAFNEKPSPEKWGRKEILGHLIDSAQNNIRRFITAQYEDAPVILYQQDRWVQINHYQQYQPEELIQLWKLLNRQICYIIRNANTEALQRMAVTSEPHSIQWLAEDYIKHLLHHLHQVTGKEPVAYP